MALHGDENGSDSHGMGSGWYLLSHFNSGSNTDMDLVEYEYKMNVSDSDIYSVQLKVLIVEFNIDK